MSVIAIDSSVRGRLVVVAATREGAVIGSVVEEGVSTLPALTRALLRLGLDGLEAVVVVNGPGSYTGVRAGMAAALGLAHPRGLPLHAVGSLEVAARAAPAAEGTVVALACAGRGGVYAGRFERAGGELRAVGEARRIGRAEAAREGGFLVTLDSLDVPGAHRGDAVPSLAGAVPAALARPPLAAAGLRGIYVENAGQPGGGARVSSAS
jgi:tRNA threonylcarbamoyladenosine biosynthesis protein TsaB